jgi:FkbM family methyltransferase
MLIDYNLVRSILATHKIDVRGVLHIGAHECEEKGFYNGTLQVADDSICWIDGNGEKVQQMKSRGFQNIYEAVLDETERDTTFFITDNTQASSLLQLNHQNGYYNYIHITKSVSKRTQTLGSFLRTHNLDSAKYNFWNLDIQGSELAVIRGSQELLRTCDAIYTEVNAKSVYHGCGLIGDLDALLTQHGFCRVHTEWTDKDWGDALYVKIPNN